MVTTQPRLCLNCDKACPEPRTDQWLMFFCVGCSDGLSPRDRNNTFVRWVGAREQQHPGADLLDGQSDTNWPAGFPARKPLR